MGIIMAIIVLVALVSLYDYFSAPNWQQVTSVVRNEVVFEKRNKKYGAYAIRKDYDKRMILILVGMVGSLGAAYAAYAAVKSVPALIVDVPDDKFDTTIILFDDKQPELIAPRKELEQTAQDMEAMVKFPELVVTDDPIDRTIKLADGDIKIGEIDRTGDSGIFIPPVVYVDPIKDPIIDIPEPPVYDFVDEEARFPQMMDFLRKNLVYPEVARELGVGGKCWLRFVVDKDGNISNVKVTRGIDECPECTREAVRVVKLMPRWKPGKVNGKAVDSYFDLPVNFVVQ